MVENLRLFFLLLLVFPVAAQCQFQIKGQILNENGDLLTGVSVMLSTSAKPTLSSRTNRSGLFAFLNQSSGTYQIRCSYTGCLDTLVSLHLFRDTVIKLQLRSSINKLKEIHVSVQKKLIEKKIDRTVYNVDNSISGAGSDALELVGKIPGIRVDNNAISIVGKGNVRVLINDRPIQLSADELSNYLKSTPSDNISKVEIITNPSARYDAQGNSGLINIILKKVPNEGLQGSITKTYSMASHPTFAGGGHINYRKKNTSIYSNLNIRDGSISSTEKTNVMYPKQTWDILNRFRNYRKVISGQVEINHQLSKKILIGGLYNLSRTDFHSNERITSSIYGTSSIPDSVIVSQANAKIKSKFGSTNVFLKKSIDSNGAQLLINADLFFSENDNQRHFDNNIYVTGHQLKDGSFAQYLSESRQNVDVYTLKADVDLPYKLYKISFGSKLSLIRNRSNLSFSKKIDEQYLPDQDQVNDFNYTENTQAVYANLNRTYTKWAIQSGLRGEYTQTNGHSLTSRQSEKNRYMRLFPTVFINYRPDERHGFSFSYGKRIDRPSYKDLNPFKWYSNQYVYMEGNPFLKPSYIDNFELSHSYKNVFMSTLAYSQTKNGYGHVNFTDSLSNQQVSKPVNFLNSYNYKLSNLVSLTKFSWFKTNNELDIIYNRSTSSLQETFPLLKGLSAYLSTSNEFYLSKDRKFSAELSFWYQFRNIDGIQERKDQYNLNAGAKMAFLKNHLHLTLNITDLLKSNKYRYTTLINNIKQTYANYYDSRQLRISIRYVFGNEKLRQLNRQTGNTEETKRN